jgi:endonuclease-3
MKSERQRFDWPQIMALLKRALRESASAAVDKHKRDPFHVLVSTVISLRTKDEVTDQASQRLLDRADTPAAMLGLDEHEISSLIYPAGFYRTKAKNLKEISRILQEVYGGAVPQKMDQLLALPGVGRKTANLVRNLGFGLPGICVDTHVHRISNRMGWVSTKVPEQTENDLEKVLPRRYWITINGLLVRFGKSICKPISPHCSTCPLSCMCAKIGVSKSR